MTTPTSLVRRAAVTSIQAVLWRLLCLAGIATPITGFGRLLREH
jgi:maleate cis-trans isomerase